MKNILLFLTLFVTVSSCIEVIEPEISESEKILVVEGLVTNLPGPYKVKLSQTNSFYSTDAPPAITDATVIISDNLGVVDTLFHSADGIYLTSKITGTVGNNYTLKIFFQGEVYEATSHMFPVTKIDSVFSNYYPKKDFLHEQGYYLAFVAIEPQATEDFYLWKFYKNNKLQNSATDIHIASDEAIAENIVGLEAPYPYQPGDTAKVEMYSLTGEAFNFYSSLNNNINNDGGFFSSPAANPPSNLSNGALGLFQVSAVEVKEIVIRN